MNESKKGPQTTVRLSAEMHERIRDALHYRKVTLTHAIEQGLKLWLEPPRLLAASIEEEKAVLDLLQILRSGDEMAVKGIESSLRVFSQYVDFQKRNAPTTGEE